MADLPGLIKGASEGLGLGYQFLRHIERCRVIVHIVDMAQEEGRDPYTDYLEITEELRKYNLRLLERPIIIVASKMDMPNAKENLEEFKKHFDESQEIIPISSLTNENLNVLTHKIADLLEKTDEFTLEEATIESFVEYNFKKEEEPFEINFEHGTYNITGNKIKKLLLMTDFTKEEGAKRFARQLRSLGIDQALRDKGVKNGDVVKIFDYEFEFID
jgi:GTP-binding protein